MLADVARHGATADIVAADHVQADAIIQFGYASREPVKDLPVFHVVKQMPYSFESLASHVVELATSIGRKLLLILDTPYAYLQDQLAEASAVCRQLNSCTLHLVVFLCSNRLLGCARVPHSFWVAR